MLYIWPYFAFFSWPLLLIPVINILLPRAYIPNFWNYGFPEKQKSLPRILTVLMVIPIMLAIVHFNTILHPFTLADNRHYVFYVFRILLRSHPALKYAAVLVYFFCGWAVLSAFGFSIIQAPPKLLQVPPSAKSATSSSPSEKEQSKETRKPPTTRKTASGKQSKQPQADPISAEAFAKVQQHIQERQKQQPGASRVSFVLVWLAATALSLVTAPLVEPRYFIIPWVMWRLHLPPAPTLAHFRRQRPRDDKERTWADMAMNAPKFLETAWFLLVNAVTCYVFLYKGFEWPQEPGMVQRFMW